MFRWRCADFLYLVVEDGIFADAEIPAGWGLLVRVGTELRLLRSPVALDSEEVQRLALLESIALAATRAVAKAAGLTVDWAPRSRRNESEAQFDLPCDSSENTAAVDESRRVQAGTRREW
jgi:hypothetical protein